MMRINWFPLAVLLLLGVAAPVAAQQAWPYTPVGTPVPPAVPSVARPGPAAGLVQRNLVGGGPQSGRRHINPGAARC